MLHFLKNQRGSFVPIVAIIAAIALPIAGGLHDYNHMLTRESELIFATHAAANAAMIEASNNDEFELIAKKHLYSNIHDPKLSAKRKLVNGRISLKATHRIELPVAKIFGIKNIEITASSCLPTEFIGINKVENTRSYSELEILELERQFRRLINAAPKEKRSLYRKEYTKHLQKIKSLNAPKRQARGYKAANLATMNLSVIKP